MPSETPDPQNTAITGMQSLLSTSLLGRPTDRRHETPDTDACRWPTAPPSLFPDAFDEDDDGGVFFGEPSGSHHLALLPNAIDDEDEDSFIRDTEIPSDIQDAIRQRNTESQFSIFPNSRVVRDPVSGALTLASGSDQTQPAERAEGSEGKRRAFEDDEPMVPPVQQAFNLSAPSSVPSRELPEEQRTAQQAQDIVDIFAMGREHPQQKTEQQKGVYEVSAEARYRMYREAVGSEKRRKTAGREDAHNTGRRSPELGERQPAAISAEARQPPRQSKYRLPPEQGQFMTCRTRSGRALYFGMRTEMDLLKTFDRLELEHDGFSTSRNINQIVADLEADLDMQIAIQLSKEEDPVRSEPSRPGKLWVDKYRPQSFLDLVSDERVNRAVMQWLKEWDCCVFGREAPLARPKKKDGSVPDKWRRPEKRILLLSGPPGLGKTTLAHVVARLGGYAAVEINASDDRTAAKVRDRILGVTQTHAVRGASKPQLLVIDEIDGVSAQGDFVATLVGLASDAKSHGPLLRPIICICNNVYAPVLRPLRRVAQVHQLHAPTPSQLVRRLEEVCSAEDVAADSWSLLALAKQAEGDIRSCLNSLQLSRAQPALGGKDIQRSLFEIWDLVFTRFVAHRNHATESEYLQRLAQTVLASGEVSRIMQGCFENYLQMGFRDLTHTKSSELSRSWLTFYDQVDSFCRKHPAVDSLHAYLAYPLLAINKVCASPLGISNIEFDYPHSEFEARQAQKAAAATIAPLAVAHRTSVSALATDTLDFLLHVISPTLTTANKQLLKGDEKKRLERLVDVMGDWQLSFVRVREADGQAMYKLDPPIDRLYGFVGMAPSRKILRMRYPVRQLVAHEIERMRIERRAKGDAKEEEKREYLEKLFVDPMRELAKAREPLVARDFFGRVVEHANVAGVCGQPARTWVHFFEGFSNAVRKPTAMKELL